MIFASTLFADAHQLALDGDGRVSITDDILTFAGIKDTACFVGRGATFQIWNPELFEVHQKEARARIKAQKETLQLEKSRGEG